MNCFKKGEKNSTLQIDYDNLKNGLSGLMRVCNDALFIETSVESCISALDELIIVYNDCTDDSADLIERMRQRYPEKIKVFPYVYHIYALGLSKEEYDYANGLSEDSPHLLCNYYNFALSKVSYKYVVKIDADQFYFDDKLKYWRDIYTGANVCNFSLKVVCGGFVAFYLKCLARYPFRDNLNVLKSKVFVSAYHEYIKYAVQNFSACIYLSGLNVVRDKDCWFVPIGKKNPIINILPPFNGAGDHVIFKVTRNTYYEKYYSPNYSIHTSNSYTIIERFVCNKRYHACGFFWFHMNMMRPATLPKVLYVKKEHPDYFVSIDEFLRSDLKYLWKIIDKQIIIKGWIYVFKVITKLDAKSLKNHLNSLKEINLYKI